MFIRIANAITIKIAKRKIRTNLNVIQTREQKLRAILKTSQDTQIATTKNYKYQHFNARIFLKKICLFLK